MLPLQQCSYCVRVYDVTGVDEHTALLLDVTTGDVLTVGVGTAYVCSSTPLEARICLEDTPLTLTSQDCIRLSGEVCIDLW